MMRGKDYKMVYYIDQPYGELYDLNKDPDEFENLWDNSEFRPVRDQFTAELLAWFAKSCYFNGGYKVTQGKKQYEMKFPGEKFGYSLMGGNRFRDKLTTRAEGAGKKAAKPVAQELEGVRK